MNFRRLSVNLIMLVSLANLAIGQTAVAANQTASPAVRSWTKLPDGVLFHLQTGVLKLQACTPQVIRVVYGPGDTVPVTKSLSVVESFTLFHWHVMTDSNYVTLTTSDVEARVDKLTGAVAFFDSKGKPIASELPGTRSMQPTTLPGTPVESAYNSQDAFSLSPNEDIYGLGQHQAGNMSYRGSSVVLEQSNREVAIPFMVSSRGYGVFWDNPAHTEVSVGTPETVPSADLIASDGTAGGLTAQYFSDANLTNLVVTRKDPQIDFNWTDSPAVGVSQAVFSARWTGQVRALDGGNYTFSTSSDDGVRLWIDDKLVIDDWNIHPEKIDTASVDFTANSVHMLKMEYYNSGGNAVAKLAWANQAQSSAVSWSSEVASAIDYYFIDGPSIDGVISRYRSLTGQAPMFGKWAFGYWQSKERYNTQQELIDVADKYRNLGLPIDNIVQDWYYWAPYPWGSNKFDPNRYPDMKSAVATLHDKDHMHVMISVWGKFDPGTPTNPDQTTMH